jgi:hypothetical protein
MDIPEQVKPNKRKANGIFHCFDPRQLDIPRSTNIETDIPTKANENDIPNGNADIPMDIPKQMKPNKLEANEILHLFGPRQLEISGSTNIETEIPK